MRNLVQDLTIKYMPNKPALSLHILARPDFLNKILKEPDDFSKYVKFLINYRGRKSENRYITTEEKIYSVLSFFNKG